MDFIRLSNNGEYRISNNQTFSLIKDSRLQGLKKYMPRYALCIFRAPYVPLTKVYQIYIIMLNM